MHPPAEGKGIQAAATEDSAVGTSPAVEASVGSCTERGVRGWGELKTLDEDAGTKRHFFPALWR